MTRYKYENPIKALGMCAIDSHEFARKTRGWGLVRVTGLTYTRREHWAAIFLIDLDNLGDCRVRDRTMRQFSFDAKPFWKGTLDDWLDDMTELLVDNLKYEIYQGIDDEEPVYSDFWVREDIEPGEMLDPCSEILKAALVAGS